MINVSMLIDIIGWLGAVILVSAFGLLSYGSVDGRSRVYQTLNTVAGVLLGVNCAWHRTWPSVAVNIIWIGIAVGALAAGPAPRRAAPDGTQ
ncbi:MAG TPA: hypothetical protein VGT07_04050 [Steroidobacteraceae bacterium]|nr:hypothetical protein [Steroidobacteraceae bacterium]